MTRRLWILIAVLGLCVGFGGWSLRTYILTKRRVPIAASSRNQNATVDCSNAPDDRWSMVQSFDYVPARTLYTVAWEICLGDIEEQRVLVSDANFKVVFFRYDDPEIRRVERIDLLGNRAPELLVVTESGGTSDQEDWHIISESNGKLHEWTFPDYDSASEKLLRSDEDFCCKDWNYHLRERELFLVRGIYHKGDGNCCPTRGGVLVRLRPVNGEFTIANVRRLNRAEYYRWWKQPFCVRCVIE